MGKTKKTVTKTREVRLSTNAFQNIYAISSYIGLNQQQPLNAVKVTNSIYAAIDRIGENPFAFKECKEIPTKTKMYRQAVSLSWLIIYKITTTEIIILGVSHGARSPSEIKTLRKVK